MKKTGARIILDSLISAGVETVFGYPGGANLHLYDEIHRQSEIKHILCCHEQACIHAAEGYARSTGKIGVAFLTSGPGATNGVTGITDAMLDSTPLLIITSQVMTHVIGSDAFQEADVIGITKPITKYNSLIKNTNQIFNKIQEGIYIATTGRKGPVLIDIPKDLQGNHIDFHIYNFKIRDSYNIKTNISDEELSPAIELIKNARKPLFYCGGGISACDDIISEKLTELAEITGFPVATTLMGLGVFDPNHKQSLHMVGMHGTYEANLAMHDADLLIAIGVRFDDRVTAKLAKFSPNSKKIHIDIDPSELGKNVKVEVPICGDCGIAIEKLLNYFKQNPQVQNISNWWIQINEWRSIKSLSYNQDKNKEILPQFALDRLYELTKESSPYFTTDVGQHQMWAAQYLKCKKPKHFITSAGLGTMGYGLPSAIGAKVAHPESEVICVTGEGSFMMNVQELATLQRYKMPVKIFMLNNNYLGMVRQWQQMFYENRHTEVNFESISPDFTQLCKAFGIECEVVSDAKELDNAIIKMHKSDKPYMLVVKTKREENVYPMIAPNSGHNEMILKD